MLVDRRFPPFFLRSVPVGLAVALGVACSDGPGNEPSCKKETGPAYVVTALAEDGPLPEDLVITARFGGGEESFSLNGGPLGGGERIMFCEAARASGSGGLGGAGGAGPSAYGAGGGGAGPGGTKGPAEKLVCNLWSDSAVTISMTATGYVFEEQELKLDFNECGAVVTTDVEAVLLRPQPQG